MVFDSLEEVVDEVRSKGVREEQVAAVGKFLHFLAETMPGTAESTVLNSQY